MTTLNKGKDQKSHDFVRVLLVLDDVVTSEIKAHQSKTLRILAARGRHTGLAVCVTAQYLKSVSPTLRNNADLMLYGKSNAHSDEILYEEYSMAGDMTHDQFMRFVRANTNDHTFLVINNATSNTSNRLNVYGSFKAPS